VITAGVDLAAMPERTALASIEWARTRAVVRDLVCPADDDVILGGWIAIPHSPISQLL
jgi:hypothetical protein